MSPQDTAALACTLARWAGGRRRCRWCNTPFRAPRRRWCSDACSEEWRRQHVWTYAREAARERDKGCVECRSDPADRPGPREVDHVEPCRGVRTASCAHHLTNLRTLCQHHHALRHQKAA